MIRAVRVKWNTRAVSNAPRLAAAVIASGDASIVAITALVGKNSAAKPILKMLEADGVVSAPDSRNRRTVLIPSNLADYVAAPPNL